MKSNDTVMKCQGSRKRGAKGEVAWLEIMINKKLTN